MSLSTALYKGASEYGRIRTYATAIILTVLGLSAIVMGAYLLFKKDIFIPVVGEVITSQNLGTPKAPLYKLLIRYTTENNNQTLFSELESIINYPLHSNIRIRYNPETPIQIIEDTGSSRSTGVVLIAIALCVVGFGWVWWWLSKKYEGVAVFQTVSDVSGLFTAR